MTESFHRVKLHLTPDALAKLASGHTIQISHSKLFNGLEIVVKKSKAFKLTRAYRNGKGTRLNLDKEELEAQGGSF